MTTTQRRYLVTGGMGCLGAWVLYHLVKRGHSAVSFDLSDNRARLNMLLASSEQSAITFVQGDLSNFEQITAAIRDHQIRTLSILPRCKSRFVALTRCSARR